MAVLFREWLDLIDNEYLKDFVVGGGAAVKFVITDEAGASGVVAACQEAAARHQMLYAAVDSSDVKLHLIQDIFFALSRQVDWAVDTQRFVEKLFASKAYQWPRPGEAVGLADLAMHNNVDANLLNMNFHQWLTATVMRDPDLAQDFRIAVMRLCLNCLVADGDQGEPETPIRQWLRGELRLISALRTAQIYAKINRHNARPMLRSLCRWLRLVGHQGLFLTIDLRQVTRTALLGFGNVRYTTGAVMDAYEVLRQLIDDIDLFEGLFVVAVADQAFIGDDPKRSVAANMALKMRVWRDVQAKDRDNPLAPLVIVESADGPGRAIGAGW